MDLIAPAGSTRSGVLVVVDWRTDPRVVIAACRRRATSRDAAFGLVVPAWLHGLDWVGDPYASRPCAARQLRGLVRIARAARLDVELAAVGDPDPCSAVGDALDEFAATEILLCRGRRRAGHPLDLVHRLRRMTGLPVRAPALRAGIEPREPSAWRALAGGGHCVPEVVRSR